jgi:hypothetical protein
MSRTWAAAALLVLVSSSFAADAKLTVKVDETTPPKELVDPIRALLSDKAINILDEKGKAIGTVWPVKSLDAKSTANAKVLKYSDIEETTIIGALKLTETWVDYRKQKIKPGVYTLRLGVQPMDGDHMGTAPYNEFFLLLPASEDKKAELLDVETMHDLSAKSTTRKHPAMMLLFPNKTPPETPAAEAKPRDHHVLSFAVPVTAGGEKGRLGFSPVILGVTMAE